MSVGGWADRVDGQITDVQCCVGRLHKLSVCIWIYIGIYSEGERERLI